MNMCDDVFLIINEYCYDELLLLNKYYYQLILSDNCSKKWYNYYYNGMEKLEIERFIIFSNSETFTPERNWRKNYLRFVRQTRGDFIWLEEIYNACVQMSSDILMNSGDYIVINGEILYDVGDHCPRDWEHFYIKLWLFGFNIIDYEYPTKLMLDRYYTKLDFVLITENELLRKYIRKHRRVNDTTYHNLIYGNECDNDTITAVNEKRMILLDGTKVYYVSAEDENLFAKYTYLNNIIKEYTRHSYISYDYDDNIYDYDERNYVMY